MSRSQLFTKLFHFSKNSRHHALKANLNWLTKTSLVCYWEWRSCIFSLPCQFEAAVRWRSGITSQELKPLLIARKTKWWNTSLNISISSISGRFPPSSITFGLMNYFNWFIYYHVTEFGVGGGVGGERKFLSYVVIRYDYYTTLLILTIAKVGRSWLNAGSFITGCKEYLG